MVAGSLLPSPVYFKPVPCSTGFVNLVPKFLYQIILVSFCLVLISTINHLLYFLKPPSRHPYYACVIYSRVHMRVVVLVRLVTQYGGAIFLGEENP